MHPPVIVLAFAYDRALEGHGYLRALTGEKHAIDAALREAERAGRCKVVVVSDATVDGLAKTLDLYNDDIAVFHFAGHAGPAHVQLAAPGGAMVDALADGVAQRLGELPRLRLVCLNGCATAEQRVRLAAACPDAAVVTTERAVLDAVASAFAGQVYRALGEGATVASAFARGEALIKLGHHEPRTTRMLLPADGDESDPSAWPWRLDGSEDARRWRLPEPSAGVSDPPRVSTARLPRCGPHLFGRAGALAALDRAWRAASTHIVEVVAWGGAGKTALVRHWLNGMQRRGWDGARRVFAWSFYAQGTGDGQTSADLFVDGLLRWLGDPDPAAGDAWARAERLAALIRAERTLLVLDGVEPLQHPPGRQGGALTDEALRVLIELLADGMDGLCVLTSRLPIADLDDRAGASVLRQRLERLSTDAGVALLGALGVQGPPEALRAAVDDYGGHALALRLLGSYLVEVEGGDIERRDAIEGLTEAEGGGEQAQRVMAAYDRWLAPADRAVLRVVSLFDRAADPAAVEVVLQAPAIEGLIDEESRAPKAWRRAVGHLVALGLVERAGDSALDVHPLVREHFAAALRGEAPEGRKAAHLRLYAHFAAGSDRPLTLKGIEPLFRAVTHGCAAGRHSEVFDEIYRRRIQRFGRYYATNALGAFAATLATLGHFFVEPWTTPHPALSPSQAIAVCSSAGFSHRALGHLDRASSLTDAALSRSVQVGDAYGAAALAVDLGQILLLKGEIRAAITRGREAVAYADGMRGDGRINKTLWAAKNARAALGEFLHFAGRLDEARLVFDKAEDHERLVRSTLRGRHGYRYDDLLLTLGDYASVRRRNEDRLPSLTLARPLLRGIGRLTLGTVSMCAPTSDGWEAEARAHLDAAVVALRVARRRDYLPRGLLARARFHRRTGDFDAARRDLDEARSIADGSGMRVYQADCRLEAAWLHLAVGDHTAAREAYAIARVEVDAMGYHRRDPELGALRQALGA